MWAYAHTHVHAQCLVLIAYLKYLKNKIFLKNILNKSLMNKNLIKSPFLFMKTINFQITLKKF